MPQRPPSDAAPQPEAPPRELLDRGVHEGIITEAQRDRLLALAVTAGALPPAPSPIPRPVERPAGFNAVTVAYGIGAMLVLFACGWFLVDRWAKLGAGGVLAVVAAYALVLTAAARWLLAHRFRLAADISTMLAVSLAPLVGWAILSMTGRWPSLPAPHDPLLHHQVWMAWQWLILDLVLLLAALVVLRKRRIVTLTWPMAVALWATWLHVGQILRGEDGPLGFDRWLMLANGVALLLVAERVERWQRREGKDGVAAGGTNVPQPVAGDFANAFWVTGLLATAVAYMALWLRADHQAWRHLLPLFSLGLVALSLFLGRRVVLLFGVAGLLGYLAFLAEDVFKDYVSFPILLAGFGILLILATVWTQTRFPALVERIDAGRRSDERPLPWSPFMAVLPVVFSLAMASLAWVDAAAEREQRAFQERLHLLRLHSGSMNAMRPPRGAPPRRPRSGTPAPRSTGNIPQDSS